MWPHCMFFPSYDNITKIIIKKNDVEKVPETVM